MANVVVGGLPLRPAFFNGLPRSPGLPEDLVNRVTKSAVLAFRYTTLVAITLGSAYFLGQGFWGRGVIMLLSAGSVAGAGVYAVRSIQNPAEVRGGVVEIAGRADRVARVILWSFLIVGALSAGFVGGCALSGASFLAHGVQMGGSLQILRGLVDITFILGYAIPFAKFVLRNSSFLYEDYDQLAIRLKNLIENLQARPRIRLLNILGELGFFFGNHIDFDTFLTVAEHMPAETLQEQFIVNLPTLSDERVSAITTRFSNILTIEFLAGCLPQERFRTIIAPRLVCPLTEEQLDQIQTNIPRIGEDLSALEERRVLNEDFALLRQEAERISLTLTRSTNQVSQIREWIRKLPEGPLPEQYADLQVQITRCRRLNHQVVALSETLMSTDSNSLRTRLQRLQNLIALPAAVDSDREDPNYEVLGAYGFREVDFRVLGQRLHISAAELSNHEIERTSSYLSERGLSNRGALIQNHILDVPAQGPITSEEIIQRIVAFCEGDAPILPREIDEVDAPVMVPQPRWTGAARIVNNVFHIALSGSLLTVEAVYQPTPVLIGFVHGLLRETGREIELITLYRPSPDYVHQEFTEFMRELCARIWGVTLRMRLGRLGGMLAGMAHANAFRYYGRQLIDRIQRWQAAA